MNTVDLSASPLLRLLVPINANESSHRGIDYAVRRHHEGTPVEVILLNIGEPIAEWQVLRFRTQQEIADFQAERAQVFIAEAGRRLDAEHIPWRGLFRPGELVFSILDVAEELDCHEIVMPLPKKSLTTMFTTGVVAAVCERQRDIPVVVVDDQGLPV